MGAGRGIRGEKHPSGIGPALRLLACALVLATGLAAARTTSPSPAAALGAPPACSLQDFLTVPRGYDDWSITLVDWLLSVGKDYKPPDLVSVHQAGLPGGGSVRKVAIDDLRALTSAAKKNGTPIGSWSAYRSYSQQVTLFNSYVKGYGYDNAVQFSQRPGHSEHQLGLVIDFSDAAGTGMLGATSGAAKWLAKNAWRYGWLLSYPPGDDPKKSFNETVCFRYEPWHYRYVGRDMAAKIHASGRTIREYLWTHFTMVDPVTGKALPTATPTPTETATVLPSPTPTSTAVVFPSPVPSQPPAAGADSGAGTWAAVAALTVVGVLLVVASIGLAARRGRPGDRHLPW